MTMATAGGLFTHGSSIIYRVIRRVMQGCLSLVCSGIVKSKGLAESRGLQSSQYLFERLLITHIRSVAVSGGSFLMTVFLLVSLSFF